MKCSRVVDVTVITVIMLVIVTLVCMLCRTVHHNDSGANMNMKNDISLHDPVRKDINLDKYSARTSSSKVTKKSIDITEKSTERNMQGDLKPKYIFFCDVGESSGDYGVILEKGYETDDEDIPDFHRMCSVLDAYSKNKGSSHFRRLLETYASVFSKDTARKGKLRKIMLQHNIPEKCKQFIMSLADAFNKADLLARFEKF